jgi:surface antigen
MRSKILVLTLCSMIAVAGCETTNQKRNTGAVVGAVAGGVLGHQVGKGTGRTVATVVGALAGAYLGGKIGQYMDEQDRTRTQGALETTPTNQATSWRNPDSGNEYTVTPTRTYTADSGPCREYTTEAIIDGRTETVYGTACRQADGSWQASN